MVVDCWLRMRPRVVTVFGACTPCRGGTPPLTVEEAEAYHGQAPEWLLLDETTRIERTYRFKNFGDAFTFVRSAGELAEAEFHHPDISFGWGYATVSCAPKKSEVCMRTISL
jgi:4a-hydroxytetrahydrobiopterin dehydratase